MNQENTAKQEMINWLSHESELGKAPFKIECTKKFNYLNMIYYIFKFKKSMFSRIWFLGVCGGYAGDDEENCGHVFSRYKEYCSGTEIDDAIELIEEVRNYWKSLAG